MLRKREGNYVYNSDSDSNPYASVSHHSETLIPPHTDAPQSEESEDEEELIRRAEAQKKELDAKLKANEEKQAAEAAKQAKKLADAAEKRLKAAEKRKETAVKKKPQKTGETSTPSPGLTAPSKKGGKRSTSPPTTSNSDTEGRRNKRPGSPFDSESSEGKKPEVKKPRKGSKVDETMGNTPPMGPPPPKKAGTKRKVDENEPGEKRDKKKKAKLETQGRAASTSPAPSPAVVITPTSHMAKDSIPQSTPGMNPCFLPPYMSFAN